MSKADVGGSVEHGGAPDGWLDFSANLNPLGTPEQVRAAIAAARYDSYASLNPRTAEAHLAADACVHPESVLLTAGATEALRLVLTELARPGGQALIVGPTYGEYARLATLAGARVRELRARPPRFRPPLPQLLRIIVAERPAVVVLCHPNNPTGQSLSAEDFQTLLAAVADADTDAGGTLVLDDSFGAFSRVTPPVAAILSGRGVVIRSVTKRLAIPGIRVGYLLGPPALLARLRAVRDPWTVGAHAIAVAGAARWQLDPSERSTIDTWRGRLAAGLAARGLDPIASDAIFVLAHGGRRARDLAARLARDRIAVRDATSFGLPGYVRVAVRPPADQARLFEALDRLPSEVGREHGR